jgi:hypothetical protein
MKKLFFVLMAALMVAAIDRNISAIAQSSKSHSKIQQITNADVRKLITNTIRLNRDDLDEAPRINILICGYEYLCERRTGRVIKKTRLKKGDSDYEISNFAYKGQWVNITEYGLYKNGDIYFGSIFYHLFHREGNQWKHVKEDFTNPNDTLLFKPEHMKRLGISPAMAKALHIGTATHQPTE